MIADCTASNWWENGIRRKQLLRVAGPDTDCNYSFGYMGIVMRESVRSGLTKVGGVSCTGTCTVSCTIIFDFLLAAFGLGSIEWGMSRPKPHYRMVVSNLQTREQLKIELIDLPFAAG